MGLPWRSSGYSVSVYNPNPESESVLCFRSRNGIWEKRRKEKRRHPWDLPGGTVVKNPPANAGGTGSIPGPGKFPHTAEQLSPCNTTTEPALSSLRATATEAVRLEPVGAPQEKPLH